MLCKFIINTHKIQKYDFLNRGFSYNLRYSYE